MRCGWHALINDLNVVSVALPERKANAPPRIHGHRPLGLFTVLNDLTAGGRHHISSYKF
jgi:hypothetical protein